MSYQLDLCMSEKISEILREFLIEERQKNPAINETAISKKIGIPPTTFNRLLNGYSKKASLSTIIKLIQFIPELKKNLPEEVVKVFEVTMEKKTSEYMGGQMLETLLYDKYVVGEEGAEVPESYLEEKAGMAYKDYDEGSQLMIRVLQGSFREKAGAFYEGYGDIGEKWHQNSMDGLGDFSVHFFK